MGFGVGVVKLDFFVALFWYACVVLRVFVY